MNKNTLTILTLILFTIQLFGLSPRQLAKLRNLEKQLTTRFNTGPGVDPNTWTAGNQTIIGQIRQLDPKVAVSYQKQQDDLTREIKERIATQQARAEAIAAKETAEEAMKEERRRLARIMAEASREKQERTEQADNVLANVGEEIITLLNSLQKQFQNETVFEMPIKEIQAIINNTEPILHSVEALLAAVSWQDVSGKTKKRVTGNIINFSTFVTDTLQKFNNHITTLNNNKNFRNRNKENFEKTAQAISNMKIILNLYRRLPRVFGYILTDDQVQRMENIIYLIERDLSTFKRELYTKYNAKVVYNGLLGRGPMDPTKVAIVTYKYDSDHNKWNPQAAIAVEDLLQDIPPSVTELTKQEEEIKEEVAGAEEPEHPARSERRVRFILPEEESEHDREAEERGLMRITDNTLKNIETEINKITDQIGILRKSQALIMSSKELEDIITPADISLTTINNLLSSIKIANASPEAQKTFLNRTKLFFNFIERILLKFKQRIIARNNQSKELKEKYSLSQKDFDITAQAIQNIKIILNSLFDKAVTSFFISKSENTKRKEIFKNSMNQALSELKQDLYSIYEVKQATTVFGRPKPGKIRIERPRKIENEIRQEFSELPDLLQDIPPSIANLPSASEEPDPLSLS